MILYLKKVRELLRKFVLVLVRHIPRAENSRADALEKLATASQEYLSRLTPVEHLAEPSIDLNDEEVSPFAIAFGTEAVAPVEIGLKSPRIELASVEHNEEAICLNLDLLDEKRD